MFRLMFPEGKNQEESKLSDTAFVDLLEIGQMVRLGDNRFYGTGQLKVQDYFTMDEEVIRYRLDVIEDLVRETSLYQLFKESIPTIKNIQELKHLRETYDGEFESDLFSIKLIETYIEIMDQLYNGLEHCQVSSEGMNKLKDLVKERCEAEEYKNLKQETAKLHDRIRHIKSVTIGLNIDGTFIVKDAGVLAINEKPFKSGDIISALAKAPKQKGDTALNGLIDLSSAFNGKEKENLDRSVINALSDIFKKSINKWRPVIKRFFNHETDFLVDLLSDIRFLTAGVQFILEMTESGYPMCKPEVCAMREKQCTLKGVYNAMVHRKLPDTKVVDNDITFDENGMFYLITGPNHGGKSVFLYSVGVAQALFQLGLYVPAKEAKISPVDNIFTHYPTSDENNYGKGRLESECARLAGVLESLDEYSFILLDEAFASTSESEASYIASEVLTGIGTIGCRGLFVTHIHELSMKVQQFNEYPGNKSKFDNLTAQMKETQKGIRSYEIRRTTPDGLSYAKDIAKKYGLELDKILAKRKE